MNSCPPDRIKLINQFSEFENELKKLATMRIRDASHGYFESPLFFRGQPGREEIVATLFRDKLDLSISKEDLYRTFTEEYSEICRWVSRANKMGLQFNFDIWNYLRFDSRVAATFVREKESLENHYPILSLARHHGCKNRLLDFTKDGYAALFFAMTSAFERIEYQYLLFCNEDGQLAHKHAEKFQKWMAGQFARVWVVEEKKRNQADIIFPDYGNNKFAHAQMAAFILAPTSVTGAGVPEITLEKLIFSKNFEYYGFECRSVFEIPYFSIPDILIQMDKFAINHIKYFPIFDSVSVNARFLNRLAGIHNHLLHLRE